MYLLTVSEFLQAPRPSFCGMPFTRTSKRLRSLNSSPTQSSASDDGFPEEKKSKGKKKVKFVSIKSFLELLFMDLLC